ncbi:hypothetical protein NS226_13820 [Aureimonas ureilytica]|uniref:Uncharacterized protein n=1 Tax=Aureimonas ureilytica TaxID=401562 RepID=A0A175R8P7_9HYPH|nr:hypothetical protein [Aureimonas ureilytica]KTQ95004.1 hypothetical protein NS226_13820 [Aureimonas ureilytica]
MKQIPSADADYKAPPEMELDRQLWDAVFASISKRLKLLEGKAITYDETVDRLTNQALALIGTNVTAEIEARRGDLVALAKLADDLSARITALLVALGADDVRIKTAIDGLSAKTVQAALVEVVAKVATNATGLSDLASAFARQRRITVASLFLGGA